MAKVEIRKTLGEGALRAGSVAAVEPPDMEIEHNRAAGGGQIGGTAHVAAVHGPADVTASGAAAFPAGGMSDDIDGVWTELRDAIDAAARDGAGLSNAAVSVAFAPSAPDLIHATGGRTAKPG
jgi:hypothetical protein